jgi:hypothetical protein
MLSSLRNIGGLKVHFSRKYHYVQPYNVVFHEINNRQFFKMLDDLNEYNIRRRLISSLVAEPEPEPKQRPTFLTIVVVASLLSVYFYYTEAIKY